MLNLRRNSGYALLAKHRYFRGRWPSVQTTAAAIVTDSHIGDVDNPIVINIVNDVDVYIVHGAIVVEGAPVPISSLVPAAHVTEPVIDAAVEADVRTPIAVMPAIATAAKTPVGRRPEGTDIGSKNPDAGDPIVAC
jgi:hypothetical protein